MHRMTLSRFSDSSCHGLFRGTNGSEAVSTFIWFSGQEPPAGSTNKTEMKRLQWLTLFFHDPADHIIGKSCGQPSVHPS